MELCLHYGDIAALGGIWHDSVSFVISVVLEHDREYTSMQTFPSAYKH